MSLTFAVSVALAGAGPLAAPPQPPVRYTVKAGDTLIALAARWFTNGADWIQVQRLNRVADPERLPVGKVLQLPRALLRVEPVGAKIVAFRGPVSVAGQPPGIGSIVREGMAVVTGADASVTVECSDGSRFSLPSATRVTIVRLRRVLLTGDIDRVFATSSGRGEYRVTPATTPDSRFMVTTPVSVSAVRGTGFRVGYDGNAAVGVVDGTVGVSGSDSDRVLDLPKGQGVAVAEGGVGKPVALLAAPELIRPAATQSAPELRFAVTPVVGAGSYVFEVGTDAGLVDRVGERRGSGATAMLPTIPDGSYFVRVTATDPNGIDGFAKTWSFERFAFSAGPPQAIGDGMRFRWQGGAGRRLYRFSLYTDEAATRALIDRDGIEDDSFTVTSLPPGAYWWRVTATKFAGGRAVAAAGELQSFTIAKK